MDSGLSPMIIVIDKLDGNQSCRFRSKGTIIDLSRQLGEGSIPGAEKIILDVSSRLLVNFAYNIV
jgi:hypothetical protein